MSEWRFELTLLNGRDMSIATVLFKLKIIGGRRWIGGESPAHSRRSRPRNGRLAHSAPIPRLCDSYVKPLKLTLRRRFIDVAPMESSKVAYYTPMPRLWFLTGVEECPPVSWRVGRRPGLCRMTLVQPLISSAMWDFYGHNGVWLSE